MDMGQLLGEILWYRRILYTNGCKLVVYNLIFLNEYNESDYDYIEDRKKLQRKRENTIKNGLKGSKKL